MSPALPQLYATLICILITLLFILSHLNSFNPIPLSSRLNQFRKSLSQSLWLQQDSRILPITSRTYVISLPRRTDRFNDMEVLRTHLGVQWSYFAAEHSNSSLVDQILAGVRFLRQNALKVKDNSTAVTLPFEWPDANRTNISTQLQESSSNDETSSIDLDLEPLTCATENFTLIPYSPQLPAYKILSPSRIACWHSHLSVIRLASTQPDQAPALIMEDDVDMEVDIHERLASVWDLLPADWDIVFLGECWR
ncbi:hypothetical protein R3P38DRAFT_2864491 [Favolaschia claudopus]|uniref:Glycosyl transferase family 25 domain-containing protein n=1 Tax=Favolaschia claudopus TaxID=2862362 RepID=A0AAW0DGJ3_9AGAR